MEYYTQEAIEKANKIDPKKKKIKKIIKFVLIVFIVYVIISNTPLFGLAVVSFRWCRPMIYKEHLQMGAIWDLRQRSYTCFTAYPLFGDPEEDEFMVEMPNKLIVTPFDIKDGYAYVHFKEYVKEEVIGWTREAGFGDVKISVDSSMFTTSEIYSANTSMDEFSKECGDYTVFIYTYWLDGLTKEEYKNKFKQIKSKWLSKYPDAITFIMCAYKNKDDYDKISFSEEWNGEPRVFAIQDNDGEIRINEYGME